MPVKAAKMGATVEPGIFICKTMWEMIISIFFGCFNSEEEDNYKHNFSLNARVMEGLSWIQCCQDRDTKTCPKVSQISGSPLDNLQ